MKRSRAPSDSLLKAVRLLLSAFMVGALGLTGVSAFSAASVWLWWPRVSWRLAERAGGALPENLAYIMLGFLALVAVMAALGYLFLRLLRRIIDTVADGDPFIPDNAERLYQMGWLVVTVQILALPAGALTGWIAYVGHIPPFDVGVSLGGILLALVLFVLARVFRKGADMRDDLEGTV